MAKKKTAGFKMKKSPNKFFGAIPAAAIAAGRNIFNPSNTKPGRILGIPRGMLGMSQGFPRGLFGGGKPNTPRHIKEFLAPNLYGRPKTLEQYKSLLGRLRNKMPKRLFGRNLEAERGGIGGDLQAVQAGIAMSPNVLAQAAPMAKKSGFTMKRGGKPNKSEFFKGKK
jgi:hypothetical protein